MPGWGSNIAAGSRVQIEASMHRGTEKNWVTLRNENYIEYFSVSSDVIFFISFQSSSRPVPVFAE